MKSRKRLKLDQYESNLWTAVTPKTAELTKGGQLADVRPTDWAFQAL